MGKNFKEGRTWTYQTRKEIAALFPYWNEDKVRRMTEQLVEKEILIKANFNKNSLDKTIWYAFKNEEMFTIGNFAKSIDENANSIGKSAKAIPDTIPDTKPNILKPTTTKPPPKVSEKTKPENGGGGSEKNKEDESCLLESISLKDPQGNVRSASGSEIFKHFMNSGYPTNIIQQAIKEAQKTTNPVYDIFKFLEAIIKRLINTKPVISHTQEIPEGLKEQGKVDPEYVKKMYEERIKKKENKK